MTSDERTEIAEKLRKTHGIMAFVEALGIDFDSDWHWTDVSRCVADLIDPTCKAVHSATSADDEFICSECGALVGIEDMFMSNYCEKCGARVVSGDNEGGGSGDAIG